MVRGRLPRILPLVAFVALAAPSTGSAQEPGVTVDPNSPSGRQYAIPLDDARSTGSGRGRGGGTDRSDAGTASGADRDEGLFGSGLSDDRSSAGGSATADRSGSASRTTATDRAPTDSAKGDQRARSGAKDGSTADRRNRDASTTPNSDRRPREAATQASVGKPGDSGGGSTPILIAVAALVLAGLAGLGARHLGRTRRGGA